MTGSTGIWYTGLRSVTRGNKSKSVSVNVIVFDRLLDLRHVARNALAPGAVFCMVSMLRNSSFQPGGIVLGMARKAELVALCNQARRVLIAVYIVAA